MTSSAKTLQTPAGALRHLLDIESLSREQFLYLLQNAKHFLEVGERELKKVPALRGKTVVNLFLEPSTRTRTSFEIAAKRLSADAINISESSSSMVKGESLLDTVKTLEAMSPDILVIRSKESGAPHLVARFLRHTAVVNAGDGMHEHPTQALLDCLTLESACASRNRPSRNLTIAIVGDVRHSRVARSSMWAHALLGNKVRLVGPATLVPEALGRIPGLESIVTVKHALKEGLEGADVVICLRLQLERQQEHFIPSLEEYSRQFGISEQKLSSYCPSALVLHPGPMNRGIEIASTVADGPRSLIESQVSHGVAARMAVLFALATRPADGTERSAARGGELEEEGGTV